MNQMKKSVVQGVSRLLRILMIASVMVSISATCGVIAVMVGLNLFNLPPQFQFRNEFWMIIITFAMLVGAIIAQIFYQGIFPEEYKVKYRDEIKAILWVVMAAVGVFFCQLFFPSEGMEIAVNVLIASVFSTVVSYGIYVAFDQALLDSIWSTDDKSDPGTSEDPK